MNVTKFYAYNCSKTVLSTIQVYNDVLENLAWYQILVEFILLRLAVNWKYVQEKYHLT